MVRISRSPKTDEAIQDAAGKLASDPITYDDAGDALKLVNGKVVETDLIIASLGG